MSDETTGAPQEGEATTETRPPVQAETAQREADALRKAQMTEAERIKLERDEAIARATAAEERANSTVLQSRFEAEAARAGCIDADAAFNLADKSLMQMQDGKPVGIGKALKALAEQRPYLFQQQPQRRSSGGNPPGGASTGTVHQRFNDWLRG
jgi:hypothetical protein